MPSPLPCRIHPPERRRTMATTGLTSTDELMLQGLYWWDIATFFRCPVERDPGNCDVALVGVPHSTGNGTTERDQHLGPRAVRDVSAMARRVHMEFGIDPWRARTHPRHGRRAAARGQRQRGVYRAHHRVLPGDRRRRSAPCFGGRGSLDHRWDHRGHRGGGRAPHRRQEGRCSCTSTPTPTPTSRSRTSSER